MTFSLQDYLLDFHDTECPEETSIRLTRSVRNEPKLLLWVFMGLLCLKPQL